jgi:Na+-transporting NADH:ubiquinone oxidoreductase subunit NqrB
MRLSYLSRDAHDNARRSKQLSCVSSEQGWNSLRLSKLQIHMSIFFTKRYVEWTIVVGFAAVQTHILAQGLKNEVALSD